MNDYTRRDISRIWQEKSDEDLLEAAASLDDYTEDGQKVIRDELKRRGLEDPVEQAGDSEAPAADSEIQTSDAEGRRVDVPQCLRCRVDLRYMGPSRFHEGPRWGLFGEIGQMFENSEAFDVYVCPECGHVDLFVNAPAAEEEPEGQ